MKSNFLVSSSPHIHINESVNKIMWLVVLSLLPAGSAGISIFGMRALWIIILCVGSSIASEAVLQKISGNKVTVFDGSAFLTGLLLAYNLPPHVPLWLSVAGSFFSIFIGKFVFGGLGKNIFNPALAGRAFLMSSWPQYMTSFNMPVYYDAVSSATPLSIIKEGGTFYTISYQNLFFGNRAGCIGETAVFALLIGAGFLFIKGYISWHIPITYIATTGLLTYIFGIKGLFKGDLIFQVLSGGLILGAFFMATDYITSPLTRKGQVIFGIGCGIITAVIRIWGGYTEGVCYAILMMNAVVPLLDRHVRPRIYGTNS